MVQKEMNRRKKTRNRYSGNSIFASKIICGECGGFYGAKVWHSNSKYRRVIYQCNNKFKNKDRCKTPHLNEEAIKELFVKAVNKLLSDKDEILAGLKIAERSLFDTSALDEEHNELKSKMAVVAEMIQRAVNENAYVAQNQEEYRLRYEGLVTRFETAKARLKEIMNQREMQNIKRNMIRAFIRSLGEQDALISEFDERLWSTLLDKVTVYSYKDVQFTFKDGTVV